MNHLRTTFMGAVQGEAQSLAVYETHSAAKQYQVSLNTKQMREISTGPNT